MDRLFLKFIGIIAIIFLCFLILITLPYIQKALKPQVSLTSDKDISIVQIAKSDIPRDLKEGKQPVVLEKNKTIKVENSFEEPLDYGKLPEEIRDTFDAMEEKTRKEKLSNYYERGLGIGLRSIVREDTEFYEETAGEIAINSSVDVSQNIPKLSSRVYKPRKNEPTIAVLSWENVKKAQEKTENNLETTKKERKDLRNFNALNKEIQSIIRKHTEKFSQILEDELKDQDAEIKAELNVLFPGKIYTTNFANGSSEEKYYPDNNSPDKSKDFFIIERKDKYRNEIKLNHKSQYFLFIRNKTVSSFRYFVLSTGSRGYRADYPGKLIWILDNSILYKGCYYNKSVVIDVESGKEKDFLDAFGVTGKYVSPDSKKAIIRFDSDILPTSKSLFDNLALLTEHGEIKSIVKIKRTGRGSPELIKPIGWADKDTFYFNADAKYWKVIIK